nr:phage tail fiber protein [uncultured Mediterranean phage uvMED]
MSQVADYNIANASGASVRSDMNAVFDAIKTLNSGGSDPTNPESFMPYVDTADNNNLKIRNSSNNGFTTIGPVDSANLGLLPVAGGTMTGQLLADDSSGASSPALSFDGDTDTGIYRSAANTIGFSTAGTQKLQVDSSGLTILGDSSASRSLVLREASNNGTNTVSIKSLNSLGSSYTLTLPPNDGSSGQFLQTDGSGVLSFATVSTFSGAASALTGNTLASGVTASSLTSVGTLTGLSVNGGLTVSQNITANGNINGDGSTNMSSMNMISATTHRASQFRNDSSGGPTFQDNSGSETAAGRLVRACVEFDGYRGGNASDNYASISGQFNVSSVTDHSEGIFTANFSSAVPSNATTCATIDVDRFTFNNHCVIYLSSTGGATTSGVKVHITNPNNSGYVLDKNSTNIAVFA